MGETTEASRLEQAIGITAEIREARNKRRKAVGLWAAGTAVAYCVIFTGLHAIGVSESAVAYSVGFTIPLGLVGLIPVADEISTQNSEIKVKKEELFQLQFSGEANQAELGAVA
ncbi:MAG TPA: hypothetical protein VLG37_00295 [Candidatus Saccharimonadales bacterium]|nr:hypothetical protein [Candidatus Saccharimonadales bacterium]